MKSHVRWIVLGAGIGAAVGLFVLLRPGSAPVDRPAPVSPSAVVSPTPSPGQSGSPAEEPSLSPSQTPEETLIEVTVRDGVVDGPLRPEVEQAQTVRIVVDADVADEVHVHGYDLMAEVEPGRPAELVFEATAPGVFEVELEDAGLLLLQLKVVP